MMLAPLPVRALGLDALLAAVEPGEPRSAPPTRLAEPLRARISIRSGCPGTIAVVAMSVPGAAVAESQQRGDVVLGLHPVQAGRRRPARPPPRDTPTSERNRSSVWIAWVSRTPPPSRASVPRPGSS